MTTTLSTQTLPRTPFPHSKNRRFFVLSLWAVKELPIQIFLTGHFPSVSPPPSSSVNLWAIKSLDRPSSSSATSADLDQSSAGVHREPVCKVWMFNRWCQIVIFVFGHRVEGEETRPRTTSLEIESSSGNMESTLMQMTRNLLQLEGFREHPASERIFLAYLSAMERKMETID